MFGTGGLAKRFYSKYKDIIDIKFCIDNDKNKIGSKFYEHDIYNVYEKRNDIKKYKIIVASSYYSEISSQLYKLKLEEYENFITHEAFGKKIAVIHGNCQTGVIKKYLENSKLFSNKYFIIQIPPIYEFKNNCIDERLLENCDLFMYQYSSEDNVYGKQVSSKYILSLLPSKCNCINIPNLWCKGSNLLFPQITNSVNLKINSFNKGIFHTHFPFVDENIDIMVEHDKNIDDIVNLLKSKDFYSKSYILKHFDENLILLKKRDKKSDVQIIDYIENNYSQFLIYYDISHPTNIVLKEIGKRILKLLDLYISEDYDQIELSKRKECDIVQIPIYPCVTKHLNLKFDTTLVRKYNSVINDRALDFEGYIREYIKWCYNIEQ